MCFKLILVPLGLVLTLAGWIADTRLGCYNVLYLSSLTMWLSTVLLVISVIIPLAVDWRASYAYVILILSVLGEATEDFMYSSLVLIS